MSDLKILAAAIASQLDGTLTPVNDMDTRDLAWIDLGGERIGLRVYLRRGYGSEATRIRATIGVVPVLRGNLDHRALPEFHTLETAAAMSRPARVIAAQIEVKVVQPALPMLAKLHATHAKEAAIAQSLADQISAWRNAFPSVRVDDPRPGAYSTEIHIKGAAGYISATLNSDGGLHISRGSLNAGNAGALVALFEGKGA